MPEETDQGIAYLLALKRSADPAPAAPGGDSPGGANSDHGADRSYQGSEKRRSPRYPCEGSVQMQEDNCDVHTWATFSDISLHGCYIEAQATYPVGTVLHLKLEAKEIRVETQGSVRVTYPYLGMGIAFTEMTPANEARLRELLASISRPSIIMGPGIASSLPARGPLELPPITRPGAVIEALHEFFRDRQMLTRDDFVRIVRQSQGELGKSESG